MTDEIKMYEIELTELELKLTIQALASAPISGTVSRVKNTVIAIESLAQKFIVPLKKEVEEEDENED